MNSASQIRTVVTFHLEAFFMAHSFFFPFLIINLDQYFGILFLLDVYYSYLLWNNIYKFAIGTG